MKKVLTLLKAIAKPLLKVIKVIWELLKKFINLFKKAFHWRNLIHYDNILATGSLLLFLGLFSGINLEVINPIGDAFNDVQLTDIAFSQMNRNSSLRKGDYDSLVRPNQDIIIVNIAKIRRDEIQEVLNTINGFKPKVIGIDAVFEEEKGFLDNTLVEEFKQTKNLILASKLKGTNANHKFKSITKSLPKFSENATYGFSNMVTNNEISYKAASVTREFLTRAFDKETGDTIYPLAVEIVKKYKPEVLPKLYARDNTEEIIDYSGNIFVKKMLLPNGYNKDLKWDNGYFEAIEYKTIMNMKDDPENSVQLDSSYFRDKIILFGYLGERIDVEESGEDLFYTPFNKRYIGKTPQDMYGVVIHANIIANILREKYIDRSNNTLMKIVGLLFTYLVFAFYRPIYDDHKVWYDGLTKFLGLAISLLILGFIGMIFDYFDYEIVFGAVWFGCILLAGDWLEIYYGLGKNLFSKISTSVKK